VRATMLALFLSSLSFIYFFVEPRFTLWVGADDIPSMLVFVGFTILVAWFSRLQHRSEADLRDALHELKIESAEKAQRAALLDLTHDSMFVRNMNDVITFWNRGAEELYGWKTVEAIGKSAHELLQTKFPMPIERIRAELVCAGRWDGEFEKTKADGSKVIVSSRWLLQRDAAGQPVSILATNNDITERKLREQEIQELNKDLEKRTAELESTNEDLEAFAYTVSHDLRAPVRHMLGFAELLQKDVGLGAGEKARHFQSQIVDSAKRMGLLIDDLLAFSRINRAESHTTEVNLSNLLQEALIELKTETGERDIVWNLGALPMCNGDRSMLRLVLVNLISNAIKFTSTRSQARIEIGCSDQNEDAFVVFVKDNGVGFDMRYEKKLFGVFQRLHSRDAFEGTGIGLATVQRIVHRHGGVVWAEADVDEGASFYFSLPKAM
jgi:PAS domain S-box